MSAIPKCEHNETNESNGWPSPEQHLHDNKTNCSLEVRIQTYFSIYTALLPLTLILSKNSENQNVFGNFSGAPITSEVRQVDGKSVAAIRLKQISIPQTAFSSSSSKVGGCGILKKYDTPKHFQHIASLQLVWIYLCLN